MTEIYVNDRILEIDKPNTIGLTFQAYSFFSSGASGFLTNSFKVPKTKENNITLNNLTNLNSDSNAPYEINTAKIVQNGIEIVTDGFAIITNTDDNYNIAIYSGNVSFFDLIKGKNVSELDWTAYDHAYNITNILASYSNTIGYIYPIIDFGKGVELLDNSTLQNADAFLPTIFGSTLLEKIITTAGFSLTGTFKNSAYYDNLISTPTKWGFTKEEMDLINGEAGGATVPLTNVVIESLVTDPSTFETIEVLMDHTYFTNAQFSSGGSPPIPSFTPSEMIYGKLTFWLKIHLEHDSTMECYVKTIIYEDGVAIKSSIFHTFGPYSVNWNYSITTDKMILKPTSVYTCRLYFEIYRHATIDASLDYQLHASSFSLLMFEDFPYGKTLSFNKLFNITQDKIISDILKIFNLVSQTNNTTKEISFNFFDDLIENKKVAKDWSSKIDTTKKISVKYKSDTFGQTNNYTYAVDELVDYTEANGVINISDVNLPAVKDIVTLNAAAVLKSKRVGDKDTPLIPFQESIGDAFNAVKQRFLLLDKQSFDWALQTTVNSDTGTATTNIPLCYFKKDGKTDNLDFPTLITNHYVATTSMVNQFKHISIFFKLNELDVVNFDFTIPIYLDYSDGQVVINGFFYANKISNFKADAPTQVELIRL